MRLATPSLHYITAGTYSNICWLPYSKFCIILEDSEKIKHHTPLDHLFITSQHGVTTQQPLPTSLSLLKGHKFLEGVVVAFCQTEENIYFCLSNKTITKINKSFASQPSGIELSGNIEAFNIYKGRIYTLEEIHGRDFLRVYDMSGERKIEKDFSFPNNDSIFKTLAIQNDQIILPAKKSGQLCIYSLDGDLVRSIPCPLLKSHRTNAYVDVLPCGDDSVIVCNSSKNEIWKVKLTTGEILWPCSEINTSKPIKLTLCGFQYILVAKDYSKTLAVLNLKTGDVVTELDVEWSDGKDYRFNIQCFDNTLVVTNFGSSHVGFFRINI